MRLVIHRGTHQIGGSCVELFHAGSRIVLDLGLPLPKPGEKGKQLACPAPVEQLLATGMLPRISGLYAHDSPSVDAVVVSHGHLDHYGLIHFVHPSIPVYMSEGTAKLLDVNGIFMPHAQPLAAPKKILAKDKPTQIGCFKVTGQLVDHSAPDALALLVEAGGKRVFYSGDLRAHGRKKVLFEHLVKNPPSGIDAMLLEGTTLGKVDKTAVKYADEYAVEKKLVEVLAKRRNMTFLFCSAQNLDRLVSAFKAARSAKAILVLDLYTVWVLRELSVLSKNIPQFTWERVRVKFWKSYADKLAAAGHIDFLNKAAKRKIEIPELVEKRADILMLMRANSLFGVMAQHLPSMDGAQLIWSMWREYLPGSIVESLSKKHGLDIEHVHSSGHATAEDLQRLAKAVAPKWVVPIHTEHPELYDKLFENVQHLSDGEWLDL